MQRDIIAELGGWETIIAKRDKFEIEKVYDLLIVMLPKSNGGIS